MGKIELWKESYRIGNDVIDNQHEELFHRIEKLIEMAQSADLEANRKQCEQMVDYLVEYTEFHFASEEALQNREGYTEYEQHKKIHQEFRNTVVVYRQRITEEFSASMLKRFLGTLLTWLTVHVQGCDQKIMKNEPIAAQRASADVEDVVESVLKKLLTKPLRYRDHGDHHQTIRGRASSQCDHTDHPDRGRPSHAVVWTVRAAGEDPLS